MKVLIRPEADSDLDGIFERISKDNPRAAVDLIRRIRAKLDLLAPPAFRKSAGGDASVEPGGLAVAPYIIVYEVHKKRDEIVVLGVFHGAMNR